MRKRVLVIGDIMVDKYVFVETNRKAPESDLPILDEIYTEYRPGGAANVANNLKTILGEEVDVFLSGIIGNDAKIHDVLHEKKININFSVGKETMFKTRYIKIPENKHLMRHDNIVKFKPFDVDFFATMLRCCLWEKEFDALIISDYDKGTINEIVIDILSKCNFKFKIVDSKRKDLSLFKNYDILKVNREEYLKQIPNDKYNCVESIFKYCVITNGSKGSEFKEYDRNLSRGNSYAVKTVKIPTQPLNAVDVTGCGDCHTAALTAALVNDKDLITGIEFANFCAGDVVQKFGTSNPKKTFKEYFEVKKYEDG